MIQSKITGIQFYNMMINANNKLEEAKEEVNALNVFPVPDGDTGTNMSMTFRAAVNEIANMENEPIGEIAKKLSKGALMGARGNSGVILSQILRGMAKKLEGKIEVTSVEYSRSILEGAKSAYKAVMRPTEGTILTVIRAAGESAVKNSDKDPIELLHEVCKYSEIILNKTPEMLPVLKKAKVVDAGGKGLLILFQGMYEVLKGNLEGLHIVDVKKEKLETPITSVDFGNIKYGYCTEFILFSEKVDTEVFRNKLEPKGDSIIVVNQDDIVKIHIHTNDPGWVLSEAVKFGQLSRIKIDNMREQHEHIIHKEGASKEILDNSDDELNEEKEFAFIAVTMGQGLKEVFNDLGVDRVIEGGQTMNPSTQDILEAVKGINAKHIFVLPNNKNIIMAATQAAEISPKSIHVIETKTIPEGITAITSYNSDLSLEQNTNNMNKAIGNVISGSVTYAVRDTEFDGNIIKEGNILGLVQGKITNVGEDKFEICEELIKNMITENTELVTVFYGDKVEEAAAEELLEKLEEVYPEIDVQFYNGKQPLYYFIISVE